MEAFVEIWTNIEDNHHVIDAEIEEAIALLVETEASIAMVDMVDVDDDDKPEAMDVDAKEERSVLTILEAEAYLDKLCQYSKARNLPPDATCLLDCCGWQMQVQHASRLKSHP